MTLTRARSTGHASAPRAALDAATLVRDVTMEMSSADRAQLKRMVRLAKRLRNRVDWRRRSQLRCSLLASALRAGERALGARYVGRDRLDNRWVLTALDDDGGSVEAIAITLPPATTIESFTSHPVEIAVRRPELVDVEQLRTWSARIGGQRDG